MHYEEHQEKATEHSIGTTLRLVFPDPPITPDILLLPDLLVAKQPAS